MGILCITLNPASSISEPNQQILKWCKCLSRRRISRETGLIFRHC